MGIILILVIALAIFVLCIFTDIDEILFGFPIVISVATGLAVYGLLDLGTLVFLIKLLSSVIASVIIMFVYRRARKTNSTNLND